MEVMAVEDIPHVFENLRGEILRIYIPSKSCERYCIFGHIYPHLHIIIRTRNNVYLVCGATGQYIELGQIMDDLRHIIELKVIDNAKLADLALFFIDEEDRKKIIEKRGD